MERLFHQRNTRFGFICGHSRWGWCCSASRSTFCKFDGICVMVVHIGSGLFRCLTMILPWICDFAIFWRNTCSCIKNYMHMIEKLSNYVHLCHLINYWSNLFSNWFFLLLWKDVCKVETMAWHVLQWKFENADLY